MKIKYIFSLLILSLVLKAQVSGNQIYNRNYTVNHNNSFVEFNRYNVTGNNKSQTYTISILNNQKADSYLVVLGLNQEGKDLQECSEKINQRINAFKSSLKSINIKLSDIYVDYITHTPIYDYTTTKEGEQLSAIQTETGFELKKNVIIKIKDIQLLDQITILGAKQDIHNLIKVDYFNSDTEEVYNKMLEEAKRIYSNRKKQNNMFNVKSVDSKPVLSVKFYAIQPKRLYQQYEAFESSSVNFSSHYKSNTSFVQKEKRKNKTFYFEGPNATQFDSILNGDNPIIGIQYVMEVSVSFTEYE